MNLAFTIFCCPILAYIKIILLILPPFKALSFPFPIENHV